MEKEFEKYKNESDVYIYKKRSKNGGKIYGSLHGKFNVGDAVIIIDDGSIYDIYEAIFKSLRLIDEIWLEDESEKLLEGERAIVVGRKLHEEFDDIIYGIKLEKNGGIIIIGEDGLKTNNEFCFFDDSFFEIK